MLDKLFGKKSPTQSQSIGNITTNGGQVQVAQAGGDAAQAMSGENAGQQQGLSGAEVAALLEQLMGAIESSSLTAAQKEELQDYLKPTKREAAKEQPDKELMGKNLKNVGETMKNLKETTEAGKTIWVTGVEVFKAIGPWVGLAAGLLG
jgi:phage-related protein